MSESAGNTGRVRQASTTDIPALTKLINAAYEVERYFKGADRVQTEDVRAHFTSGEFLVLEEAGKFTGCIYVEASGKRGYFGLLAVDPARQGCGLGRILVRAAEDRCRAAGCETMWLRIVSLRDELKVIYGRMGYSETVTEPWDPRQPLRPGFTPNFIQMEKKLETS